MIYLGSIAFGVAFVFLILVLTARLRNSGFDRAIALLAALLVTPILSVALALVILKPDGDPEGGLAVILGIYASIPAIFAAVIAVFALRNLAHRAADRLFGAPPGNPEDAFE